MKPARKPFLGRLSAKQIKQLCTMAQKAFKAARSRHALDDDMTAEDFRHAGQMEAAQVESLRTANQGQYLEIRGKWWTVIGNLEQAFHDFLLAGPQEAARKQMAWRLAGQLSLWADAKQQKHLQQTAIELPDDETARQAWAYASSIARDTYKRGIENLTWEELEQLGFTLVNRTSALRGVGRAENRNKSQRQTRQGRSDLEADDDLDRTKGPGLSLIARRAAQLLDSASRPH